MTLELTQEDFDELARPWQSLKYGGLTFEERHGASRTAAPSKDKRWIPAFATNDAQLQAVLLHAAVQYVFRDKPIPPDFIPDLATVVQLAKERHAQDRAWVENHSKLLQQRIYQHIICVEQAGGYVAFNAAIAFRCWRLMWPSRLVAEDLGVTVLFVRQVTEMLADYAESLGFETYEQHGTKGTIKVDQDLIAGLWLEGNDVKTIRRRLGHNRETIYKVLKLLGVFSSRYKPEDADSVADLWMKNLTVKQIAECLHRSQEWTIRVLRERGLYEAHRQPQGKRFRPRPAVYSSRKEPTTSAQRASYKWYEANREDLLAAQALGITLTEYRRRTKSRL